MASALLGRVKCPHCGFEAAHVKRSEKGTVYSHCPQHDCGAQYFPRNETARQRLLDAMRPEGGVSPAPAPAAKPPAAEPAPALPPGTGSAPASVPPPAPKRRALPSFFS